MLARRFAFLQPAGRSSPGSSIAKRSPRRLVLEVELLEDRSMLSGVSFLQMPPIDTYAGASVMTDYWRMSGPPAALALADLNGDGRLDIITIAQASISIPFFPNYPFHQLVWYQNNGGVTPTFTPHPLSFTLFGSGGIFDISSVAAMDVNGDGRVDLVVTLTPADPYSMAMAAPPTYLAWLENTGNLSAPFIAHVISYVAGFAPVISIQDVNGDGRPDIVVSGYFAHQPGMVAPTWWDNAAGNGTVWVQHPFNGPGPDPSWATGYLNGGGYLDSVHFINNSPRLPSYWVENRGPGQPTITHPINVNLDGTWYVDVQTGDLNGDGRPDIVYLSSGQLSWLENVPGPVTLTTTNIAPPTLNPGQAASVLRIDVNNSGLTTIDFRSVALFLAEPAGLTNSTPANLTASVSIYGDNGSGQFNSADPLLGRVTNVSLLSTQLQVQLNAGSSSTQVAAGRTASFFVVMQLSSTPSGASPGFEVAWMPQGTSLVDEATGLGLAFEIPGNLTSSLVLVPGTAPQS